MSYKITRTDPVYCQVTDANLGTKTTVLPNTYETRGLAVKLALRMTQGEYDGCGDSYFGVVDSRDARKSSRVASLGW